jgi:DNA-binding transcriptional LysR family regulator
VDLCQVRYFLAVCSEGSFTAAAKVCGVSQPSVTTGVRRLESAIGGKLFERSHPVRLTALGSQLRPVFEDMQIAADHIAAVIMQHASAGAVKHPDSARLLGRFPTPSRRPPAQPRRAAGTPVLPMPLHPEQDARARAVIARSQVAIRRANRAILRANVALGRAHELQP